MSASTSFTHDADMISDKRMLCMVNQLGMEGYGIFWALLEMLCKEDEHKLPIDTIPALAARWETSKAKVETVISKYGLFDIENGAFFYSQELIDDIKAIDDRLQKRKNSAMKAIKTRWEKQKMLAEKSTENNDKNGENNTYVIRTNYERNTNVSNSYNNKEINSLENQKDTFLPQKVSFPPITPLYNINNINNNINNNWGKIDRGVGEGRKNNTKPFVKPTLDEIKSHIAEKGLDIDAEMFYTYYESVGWMIGKKHMKNWRMAIMTWVRRQRGDWDYGKRNTEPAASPYDGCLH